MKSTTSFLLLLFVGVAFANPFLPPRPTLPSSWEASIEATLSDPYMNFNCRYHEDGDTLFATRFVTYMPSEQQYDLKVWGSVTAKTGKEYEFTGDQTCNATTNPNPWEPFFSFIPYAQYKYTAIVDRRVCDMWQIDLNGGKYAQACFEGNTPVMAKFISDNGQPMQFIFTSFLPGKQDASFFEVPSFC